MSNAVQVEFIANGVHDRQGNLLVGGKVWTYSAGTNRPMETYLDRNTYTPASNPIVLDGEGKATVFASGAYKFVIQDADGATIKIMDGFSYADPGAALSSELVVDTSDPQITIKNGAYEAEVGVGSTGDLTIKPPGDVYIESATPRVILDNGAKQVTLEMDTTTGALEVETAKGITIDNGVEVLLEPGLDSLGSQVLKVSKGINIPTPFRVTTLADAPQILTDSGVTKIRGAWRFDSGGLSSIDLLGTGSRMTLLDGAVLETGNGFKPSVVPLADVFTPGAGWSIVAGTGLNYCVVMFDRVSRQGILVMNGSLLAASGATSAIGSFSANYRINTVPGSIEVPVRGRVATPAALSGFLSLNHLGGTLLAWDDGTAVAAGQLVYLSGVVIPMLH
jgi:hypothetical protein